MRWEVRSSTALDRPLLSPPHTLINSHAHSSLYHAHHLFSTFWNTCFLLSPTPISVIPTFTLILSLSFIPHTFLHLSCFHMFLCFASSGTRVLSRPSTSLWWTETLDNTSEVKTYLLTWYRPHPADRADGLTGVCGDTHSCCSLVRGSVALISDLWNTCYWQSSYCSIKMQFWSPVPSIRDSLHNLSTTEEFYRSVY